MTDDRLKHLNDYGAANCSLLTISTYLRQRKIDPATATVTINGEVVPPELWDQYNIGNNDEIRVIRAQVGSTGE